VINYDPMGYAPNYSWATSSNASGPSKYGMTTSFDNLVKYYGRSGEFTYGATVGLGEQAGNSLDGRKYASAASWSRGGLSAMASYERINGNTVVATGNRDRILAFHMAVSYRAGHWNHMAGMRGYKQVAGKAGLPDVRADTYWIGTVYQLQPALTLTGAVYHVNVKNVAEGADADPSMYVLRAMYALSKRTDLYLVGAHATARNSQLVSLSRDDAGFASSQSGITAGIQHRF
jgi:predicted porin